MLHCASTCASACMLFDIANFAMCNVPLTYQAGNHFQSNHIEHNSGEQISLNIIDQLPRSFLFEKCYLAYPYIDTC